MSDCDIPDLSLRLGSGSGSGSGGDVDNEDECRQSSQQQRRLAENKITIFYSGQICVCDVTEIQARAIKSMAMRETEEKEKSKSVENNCNKVQQHQQQSKLQQNKNLAPNLQHPQLPNSGLSMKRSLQRFLQKRKARINAISPYNHR